jgi:hypothetical protein
MCLASVQPAATVLAAKPAGLYEHSGKSLVEEVALSV